MPSNEKLKVFRTHGDALGAICDVCWRKKGSMRPVSQKLCDLIRKHVYSGYSKESEIHPTVTCDSCRLTLSDYDKVKFYYFCFPNYIFNRMNITQKETSNQLQIMKAWHPN